jgi:hypothetical protein
VTFRAEAEAWLSRHLGADSTIVGYRSVLRWHVYPAIGDRQIRTCAGRRPAAGYRPKLSITKISTFPEWSRVAAGREQAYLLAGQPAFWPPVIPAR